MLLLRKTSFPILHTACGDIRDVSLEDNVLTIYTTEEYLFNIISKKENLELLREFAQKVNEGLTLDISLKKDNKIQIEENIKKLKSKFGDILIVE